MSILLQYSKKTLLHNNMITNHNIRYILLYLCYGENISQQYFDNIFTIYFKYIFFITIW